MSVAAPVPVPPCRRSKFCLVECLSIDDRIAGRTSVGTPSLFSAGDYMSMTRMVTCVLLSIINGFDPIDCPKWQLVTVIT